MKQWLCPNQYVFITASPCGLSSNQHIAKNTYRPQTLRIFMKVYWFLFLFLFFILFSPSPPLFFSYFLCFFSTWFIMFPLQVTSKRELPWIFLNHYFIWVYWIAKISAKDSPTANGRAPHIPHRPHPHLPAIQFSVDCISGSLLGLSKEIVSSQGLHPHREGIVFFLLRDGFGAVVQIMQGWRNWR